MSLSFAGDQMTKMSGLRSAGRSPRSSCWFDGLVPYQGLKRQRVFVVPGRSFFTGPPPGQHGTQCFRITLSVDQHVLREGIRRIGLAVGQAIGVGFGDHAAGQAASDAFRSRPTA